MAVIAATKMNAHSMVIVLRKASFIRLRLQQQTSVKRKSILVWQHAGTFKARYANHKKSINSPRYSNETELSKYAWKLKQSNRPYTIKWPVLSHASPYTAGANSCNLCLEEKFYLMKSLKDRTLNKRTELFSKCRHRNSFSARNFKRTRAWSNRVSGPSN
jgi:hypothetical protein